MKRAVVFLMTLAMAFSLFACGDTGDDTNSPDEGSSVSGSEGGGDKTLKIGFLGSLSGNAAVMGQDARNALELYCEQRGNKLGDYNIELYIEDDEDSAETAVTKCTKLVEQYDVDVILGPQNAGGAQGIADYLVANEVPLIMYHAPVDSITKSAANDYCVRVQLSASQGTFAMGDYAYNTLGYRTAAIFTYDFVFGYDLAGGFQQTFTEAGGKVNSRQFAPIGTTDFAPMLANIDWDNTDVLVYQFSGGDGSRFCQALVDAGITERDDIAIICLQNGVDELYLSDLPLELADVPFYSVAEWALDCDNQINKDFVKLYNEKYGSNPSCHAENTFAAMTCLETAIESGVDPKDGAALVSEIRALTNVEVPRGVIYSFDEYGQAVTDVCIRKLVNKDGALYNALEYVYPEVSQFWTYDPQEFMTQPAYSVDYPPITE